MYTNSLLGTAYDERHVWRPAAQQRLEQAKHDGAYADVPCECGEVSAIFEPGDEQQYSLLLVPVQAYDVGTLLEFMVHDDTCDECNSEVRDLLGWEQDWLEQVHEGAFTLADTQEELEEPEQAQKRYHQQQAGEMYDERYSERVDEGEVPAKHLEQTTLALGEQHRIRRLDTGDIVEATVVQSDHPERLDDGDTVYCVVEYSDEDQAALTEALDAALNRCRINSYGKPMHALLRGRDSSVCGVPLDGMADPGEVDDGETQGTWPASEGWDSLGGLLDDWLEGGNSMYCTECAKGLAEQTDTLRGFSEDALLRFARGHERAKEA